MDVGGGEGQGNALPLFKGRLFSVLTIKKGRNDCKPTKKKEKKKKETPPKKTGYKGSGFFVPWRKRLVSPIWGEKELTRGEK